MPTQGIKVLPRQNAGAILVRSTQRYLGQHQAFKLVMAVQRPPVYHRPPPASKSLCEEVIRKTPTGENSSFCTSMRPILRNTERIIQNLEEGIRETEGEIEALLHGGMNEQSRRTRAPLEIVGELSKTVFGTAMEKEVWRLRNVVHSVHSYLNSMSNYTVRVRDISVHFMNDTATKIENMSQDLLQQASFIKHIVAATEETKRTLASVGRAAVQEEWWIKYILAVMTSKLLQAQTLRGYLSYKREFVGSLERLREGKVSSAIIPTREMIRSITDVTRHVTKMGYELLIKDLGFYYDDFMTAYTFSAKHLYLSFQIPIARTGSLYHIFRITTFPVPINAMEHAGYSRLTNLPDYIMINNVTQSYIEANRPDLDECVTGHLLLCPLPLGRKTYGSPSCALGLYLNDRSMTRNECAHVVSPGATMPTLLLPVGGLGVIASHGREEASLACSNNNTVLEPCSLCSYTIPCHCSLKVGSTYISGMDPQCAIGKLTVTYAINLPIIDAFNISLRNASPAVTFQTPLDIKIPNITSYIRKITQRYGKDYAIELRQYAAELRSMSTPELAGDTNSDMQLGNDGKTMSMVFSLILSVVAAILAAAALYRTNKLLGMAVYASAVRGDRIQLSPAVPTLPDFPSLTLKEPTANIQDMISAMTYQEKIMTGVLLLVLFYIVTKALRAVGGCILKTCCRRLLCGVLGARAAGKKGNKGPAAVETEVWLKVHAGGKIETLLLGIIFDEMGVLTEVTLPQVWIAYVDVYCLSSVLCLSSNLTINYQVGNQEKRFVAGDRVWTNRLQGTRVRAALNNGGETGAGEAVVVLRQGDKRRQLIPNEGTGMRPRGSQERRRGRPVPHMNRRTEELRGGAGMLYPCPTPSSPEIDNDSEEGVSLMKGHYVRGEGRNGLTPPPPPKYDMDSF